MAGRYLLLFLLSFSSLGAGGCRSCSSCNDYSPPVADCGCNSCGTQRAGSASGGYATGYSEAEGEYAPPGAYEEGAW